MTLLAFVEGEPEPGFMYAEQSAIASELPVIARVILSTLSTLSTVLQSLGVAATIGALVWGRRAKRSLAAPNVGMTEEFEHLLEVARQEAASYNSPLGPEHMLLAMLRPGESYAIRALSALNVDVAALRSVVRSGAKSGNTKLDALNLPYTARAHRVLLESLRAANEDGVNFATADHLLMGILREGKSDAAKALANAGITKKEVRQAVAAGPLKHLLGE